jgi:hypothetical protein
LFWILNLDPLCERCDIIYKVYLFLINIDFKIFVGLINLFELVSLSGHDENANLSEIGPSLFGLQLVNFSALFMLVQAPTSSNKQSVGFLMSGHALLAHATPHSPPLHPHPPVPTPTPARPDLHIFAQTCTGTGTPHPTCSHLHTRTCTHTCMPTLALARPHATGNTQRRRHSHPHLPRPVAAPPCTCTCTPVAASQHSLWHPDPHARTGTWSI